MFSDDSFDSGTTPACLSRHREELKWTGPDLPVSQSWKKNVLHASFWIHLSLWLSEFSFAEQNEKKSLWRTISLSKEKPFEKVYFQSEAGELAVDLWSVLSFPTDTPDSACPNNSVVRAAREMDVMVCTSEWQEGCLSCSSSPGYWHLSPQVFLLPSPHLSLSLPPQHTPIHTRTLTHTVLLTPSPHFQSISATYLSHHSNCSQ